MKPTPTFRQARDSARIGDWYYFPEAGRYTIEEMEDGGPSAIGVTAGKGYANEKNAALFAASKELASIAREAVEHLEFANVMRLKNSLNAERGVELMRRILIVLDRI